MSPRLDSRALGFFNDAESANRLAVGPGSQIRYPDPHESRTSMDCTDMAVSSSQHNTRIAAVLGLTSCPITNMLTPRHLQACSPCAETKSEYAGRWPALDVTRVYNSFSIVDALGGHSLDA